MRNRGPAAADAWSMSLARVSYDGELDDFQADAEAATDARRHAYFADGACRAPDQPHLHDARSSAATVVMLVEER